MLGNEPRVMTFPLLCGYLSSFSSLPCLPPGPGETLAVSIFNTHAPAVAEVLAFEVPACSPSL